MGEVGDGLRRALVMNFRCCVEVWNHYIVHLRPILHCMFTNRNLNKNSKKKRYR